MKKIKLLGIRYKFGEDIVTNEDMEKELGLPLGWIIEKTGKRLGHAWKESENAPVLASVSCFNELISKIGIDKNKIKAVFGTTNPITIDGITDNLSLTHKFVNMLGLQNIEINDCGYGCGGTAIGMKKMKEWFQDKEKNTYVVYVTQDWSTKMVRDRNVKVLFSDAVSVSLWSNSEDDLALYKMGDVFAIDSTISEDSLGIIDGVWKMDGKDVVKQALEVPGLVAQNLGIDLADYDIVPHQPNAKLLEAMENKYKIKLHKEIFIEHGNPTCSGAFIALQNRIENRKDNDKRDILVMPFGAGGVGGFVLKRI